MNSHVLAVPVVPDDLRVQIYLHFHLCHLILVVSLYYIPSFECWSLPLLGFRCLWSLFIFKDNYKNINKNLQMDSLGSQKLKVLLQTTHYLYGQKVSSLGGLASAGHAIFKQKQEVNIDEAVQKETKHKRVSYTVSTSKEMEVKNSGYLHLDINALCLFQAMMKVDIDSNLRQTQEYCYEMTQTHIPKEIVRLNELREPREDFLNFFIKSEVTEETLIEFYNKYGLIVPQVVILGGMQCQYTKKQRISMQGESNQIMQGQADGQYKVIKAKGEIGDQAQNKFLEENKNQISEFQIFGGDIKVEGVTDEWLTSLEDQERRAVIEVQDSPFTHEFLNEPYKSKARIIFNGLQNQARQAIKGTIKKQITDKVKYTVTEDISGSGTVGLLKQVSLIGWFVSSPFEYVEQQKTTTYVAPGRAQIVKAWVEDAQKDSQLSYGEYFITPVVKYDRVEFVIDMKVQQNKFGNMIINFTGCVTYEE